MLTSDRHRKLIPLESLRWLLIAGLIAGPALFAMLNRPSANPFRPRQIEGRLLTWDVAAARGWIAVGGLLVQLRLAGDHSGPPPSTGCHAQAYGAYETSAPAADQVFTARLLIISRCPSGGATLGLP